MRRLLVFLAVMAVGLGLLYFLDSRKPRLEEDTETAVQEPERFGPGEEAVPAATSGVTITSTQGPRRVWAATICKRRWKPCWKTTSRPPPAPATWLLSAQAPAIRNC